MTGFKLHLVRKLGSDSLQNFPKFSQCPSTFGAGHTWHLFFLQKTLHTYSKRAKLDGALQLFSTGMAQTRLIRQVKIKYTSKLFCAYNNVLHQRQHEGEKNVALKLSQMQQFSSMLYIFFITSTN